MDTLLGIIGSVLSGGATGLLGMVIQRLFEHKDKQTALEVVREQNRCAEALATIESARTQMQVEGQIQVAMEQRYADETESYAALQAASYEHDSKESTSDSLLSYCVENSGKVWGGILSVLIGLTAVLRKGIRPWLTVYLCIITTFIYIDFSRLIATYGQSLSTADLYDMVLMIVKAVIYLTTTCVVWWFGASNTRQKDAP